VQLWPAPVSSEAFRRRSLPGLFKKPARSASVTHPLREAKVKRDIAIGSPAGEARLQRQRLVASSRTKVQTSVLLVIYIRTARCVGYFSNTGRKCNARMLRVALTNSRSRWLPRSAARYPRLLQCRGYELTLLNESLALLGASLIFAGQGVGVFRSPVFELPARIVQRALR
jgi:hypothetical protein